MDDQSTIPQKPKTMLEADSQSSPASAQNLWAPCRQAEKVIGKSRLLICKMPDDTSEAIGIISEKLEDHYISEAFLRKHNKSKIADWLRGKLPETAKARSGELGEILATEFVNSDSLPFEIPINRLRWKDEREMAMRGDDLLGFQFDAIPIRILKGEVKSKQRMSASVIAKARKALANHGGLPNSHTLSFICERLFEKGENEKADAIQPYVLKTLPRKNNITHLIFTFSQNDPLAHLENDVANVQEPIEHISVALTVSDHQGFIQQVYSKVA